MTEANAGVATPAREGQLSSRAVGHHSSRHVKERMAFLCWCGRFWHGASLARCLPSRTDSGGACLPLQQPRSSRRGAPVSSGVSWVGRDSSSRARAGYVLSCLIRGSTEMADLFLRRGGRVFSRRLAVMQLGDIEACPGPRDAKTWSRGTRRPAIITGKS